MDHTSLTTNTSRVRFLLAATVLIPFFVALLVPAPTQASYVIHDRYFATQAELVDYLEKYLRVWRELHGVAEPSPNTGSPVQERPEYAGIRVTTRVARDVEHDSALLQGSYRFDSARDAHFWFAYGTSPLSLDQTTALVPRSSSDRSTRLERSALGLTHNTTYYYRFAGKDDRGRVTYGTVESFRTPIDYSIDPADVRVRTLSADHIGTYHAVLRGSIDLRDEEQVWVWFEYGETADDLDEYTNAVLWNADDGSTYERTLRNLSSRERYHYRIVTQDMQGRRAFGRTYSFLTHQYLEDERPRVTIDRATAVSRHQAVISGTVDMKDHRGGTVFLVYGTRRDYIAEIPNRYTRYKQVRESGDNLQKILLSDGLSRFRTYEELVYGLAGDTTHYFTIGVAYDDERDGQRILLGSIQSFKTAR